MHCQCVHAVTADCFALAVRNLDWDYTCLRDDSLIALKVLHVGFSLSKVVWQNKQNEANNGRKAAQKQRIYVAIGIALQIIQLQAHKQNQQM